MRRPSLKILKFANEAISKARGGGSREAIVEAAERLFLERGFGSVTMDELAEAAGVARRTLTISSQARRRSSGKCSSGCRVSSSAVTRRTRCAPLHHHGA